MKKLFPVIAALVFLFAISPLAAKSQSKRPWIAPKSGVWRVSAKDEENIRWSGSMHIAIRPNHDGTTGYRGYFYWISDDKETSGREYFRGSFNKSTGKLRLKAYAVKNIKGELGIGNYLASVNRKGKNIFRGSWSGAENVPGKWSAVWSKGK